MIFVKVIAWFVVIFGINAMSDILKLLYVISRAVRRVKLETILKYHEWYLCHISLEIMLLFVYTTSHTRFVIFTCRYFKIKLKYHGSKPINWRNFSCSSIMMIISFLTIVLNSCHKFIIFGSVDNLWNCACS